MAKRKGLSDEWITPPPIIAALGGAESFDLDPATRADAPWRCARRYYTKGDNGLLQPWDGRVWGNFPYSQPLLTQFMSRLALHDRGTALVFARTDTTWWRDHVWGAAAGLFFLFGRVDFYLPDGTRAKNDGGAPSVLVAYGSRDLDVLAGCDLAGEFVPRRVPRSWLVAALDLTWPQIVARSVGRGGPVKLDDLYRAISTHPRTRRSPTWRATVRRTLQEGPFRHVRRGEWEAA